VHTLNTLPSVGTARLALHVLPHLVQLQVVLPRQALDLGWGQQLEGARQQGNPYGLLSQWLLLCLVQLLLGQLRQGLLLGPGGGGEGDRLVGVAAAE